MALRRLGAAAALAVAVVAALAGHVDAEPSTARVFTVGSTLALQGVTAGDGGLDMCEFLDVTYGSNAGLDASFASGSCGLKLVPRAPAGAPAGAVPVTPVFAKPAALLAVHVNTDGVEGVEVPELLESAVREGFDSSATSFVGEAEAPGGSFGALGLSGVCAQLDSRSTIVQTPRLASCTRGGAVTVSWTQGAMVGLGHVEGDLAPAYERNLPGHVPGVPCVGGALASHQWCLRNKTLGGGAVLSVASGRAAALALWELETLESLAKAQHGSQAEGPAVVHLAIQGPAMLARTGDTASLAFRAYLRELHKALEAVAVSMKRAHGGKLLGAVASYSGVGSPGAAPRVLTSNLGASVNVTAPTMEEISDWQITLWTGIALLLTALVTIHFVASADVVRDPMLYSQFKSNDRRGD